MKQCNIVLLVLMAIGVFIIFNMCNTEDLCVRSKFGPVTSAPVSAVTNANMALVHTTSLGQAPLGDPRFWQGPGTPLNQGQYGIRYQVPTLGNVEPRSMEPARYPVYTDQKLSPQCTPINSSSTCNSCVG